MLVSLHIENIAVIRSVTIELTKGFIVMTGETGAGKSVILDGIGLLLGAKADKGLIRHGESQLSVTGLFDELSTDSLKDLADVGLSVDDEGRLLIQRTVSLDGKSQIRINGRTVNLAVLRAISHRLVNIHSQSDTGALLEAENHLDMIDIYADNAALLEKYRSEYIELQEVRQEIEDITRKENERERMLEMLAYQIKDIDSLGLRDGEEEELIDKKVKIRNSEKITKNAEFVYKALKGSEKGSVHYLLNKCVTALSQLSGVVNGFDEYASRLGDMIYQIDDISEEVAAVLDEIDCDPTETLNGIESRLDKISKLKRKYGATVRDILEFRERAYLEYMRLSDSENVLRELKDKEEALYGKALLLANELHRVRVEKARELEMRVKETLEQLDMPKVVFFASIKEEYQGERKVLFPTGSDKIEFFISANRGAEAQSISKIASGGELARIMLALKSVIADKDGIATVIYDEIDAGVSGKTARKIGIKLLSISRGAQIVCVTHSAQIASLADIHLLIKKGDKNGVTETTVTPLDRDGRVTELSRILGGINVTESQRKAALDMLNEKSSIC